MAKLIKCEFADFSASYQQKAEIKETRTYKDGGKRVKLSNIQVDRGLEWGRAKWYVDFYKNKTYKTFFARKGKTIILAIPLKKEKEKDLKYEMI